MKNIRRRPLELYVHIPFCVRKCQYCDFLSGPSDEETKGRYIEALLQEIHAAEHTEDYEIVSVFIGGGTPSALKAEAIASVMRTLQEKFFFCEDAEVTIEANPGTVDSEKLMTYRNAGINRLSLGLQSTDAEELKMLGRIHSYEEFLQSYQWAREAGFSNINIEPYLSLDNDALRKNLEEISANLPDKMIENSYYIEKNNLIITKGKEGKQINIDEMVGLIQNEIYNLNFNNTPIEIQTITTYPSEVNLEAIHQEIYKEAKDAYYTQNPYKVHPSENGLDFKISMEEAQNLLANAQDTCTIPLKVTYPKISTNMVGSEAFPNLLSTFSTNYNANQTNRTTNLRLAANKINGTVLMPGQTFSYNKVVGNRTTAAGYKEAGTYVNGQIVDGVGGGICQITTTLYNAVLYANLDIVQRTNHQFIPSYSTASRDATVVYGAIDFQFKNNREYPIKIYCSVSGGVAKCNIFGVKTANDYEVQLTSRITSTTSNAIYSEAYKILKKNGTVVSTTLLSKDKYLRH